MSTNLSADDIMRISINKPELLFSAPEKVAEEYKLLAKKWHPDLNKSVEASKVFMQINVLHQVALSKAKNNAWGYVNTILLPVNGSYTKQFNYLACVHFELGEIYICDKNVIFATEKQYDDLVKQYLSTTTFEFANDDMKKEMVKFLPQNVQRYDDKDRTFVVVDRPLNSVRLADLISVKKKLDPKLVAWIMSRMYGLACYLNYANISHFDFTPESFFVDIESHGGSLLGGWYYAGIKGLPNLAAPQRVSNIIPKIKEVHPNAVHLNTIKQAGRKMLGVSNIASLRLNKDVPTPLRNWLCTPSGNKPVEEFKKWNDCLVDSFGARRFTKFEISVDEIYGEE